MFVSGRVIIVDWAIPKDKFVESRNPTKKSVKTESVNEFAGNTEETIKEEGFDESSDDEKETVTIKTEDLGESADDESIFEESDDSEEFAAEEDAEMEQEIKTEPEKPRPKTSHDIPEGKTVFLRNISFNVTNDELKAFMETIGPVYYAVICVDPLTEHSKGTGFVKFKVNMLLRLIIVTRIITFTRRGFYSSMLLY